MAGWYDPNDPIRLYLRRLPPTSIVTVAKTLTPRQRNKLLAHVRGPQPIVVPDAVLQALIGRGLVRGDRDALARRSLMTPDGRAVAALLLAAQADTLLEAAE